MAHARRKFHELWINHGSPVCEQALKYFGALYDVEREVADADSQARLDARRRSRPVADALRQWLRQPPQKIPDGSATARAIDYSLNRWVALMRFLDDGDHVSRLRGQRGGHTFKSLKAARDAANLRSDARKRLLLIAVDSDHSAVNELARDSAQAFFGATVMGLTGA